jgi:predicted aconitase
LEEAFQGEQPEKTIDIHLSDLQKAASELSTAQEGLNLDLVILGCPHFSFDEFRQLADLIQAQTQKGQTLHPGIRFIVISSQTSYSLLQRSDFIDTLTDFGVEITLDTCMFHTPMVSKDTKVIMTNSGKCAYYAPGELSVQVAFANMAECVDSAVNGLVCKKESLWKKS